MGGGIGNNIQLGDIQEIKIGTLAKRMTSYYLFQKKIENVFNYKISQQNNNNINIYHNPSKWKIDKLYVLDYDWIRRWKEISKYNNIKKELDRIYSETDDKNLIKSLQLHCQLSYDNNLIINYEDYFSFEPTFFSIFMSNNKWTLEDLDCLVDEQTYHLFKGMSFWNRFSNKIILEGIISDKIIILFFDNNQIVKILFQGIIENKSEELIQLTAIGYDFIEGVEEFDYEKSIKKYNYLKKYIKSISENKLLEIFENQALGFQEEIQLEIDDDIEIKIINENLKSRNLKYINQSQPFFQQNINFKNINQERLIGLENVGATCYMNATLQCFINIDSLTRYLLTEPIYKQIDSNDDLYSLSRAYCHLLEKVCLDDNIKFYYAPREFKRVISEKNSLFQGISANDSKDLINFMLEVLNCELSQLYGQQKNNYSDNILMLDPTDMMLILENYRVEFSKNNKSIIAQNFFFILQTNTVCNGCHLLKYNFQTLFLLEFPLEIVYNYCLSQNLPSVNNQGRKCVNLITCFEQYQLTSYFTGENQLYCNNCKGLREAECKNILFSLPPVLVLILNRGKGKSFDCDVDFPEFLNLQNLINYKKSICEYRLRGVISHLGESGMSGHFIAYCRHRINNKWYCYNDAKVIECMDQKNGFMAGTPYILFYETINNQNNILFDNNIDVNLIRECENKFNQNTNQSFNNFNFINNDINFINTNNSNNSPFNMPTNNQIINTNMNDFNNFNNINNENNNINEFFNNNNNNNISFQSNSNFINFQNINNNQNNNNNINIDNNINNFNNF